MVGEEEGKKGRVGEKGSAQAQDIGLVAPARMTRQDCRASACGATERSTSSLTQRSAGSGRQRGHPVAPHALARQCCRARRAGGTRPMSWAHAGIFSRTLSFLPSLLPDQSASRATPPPQIPPNPAFWRGKSEGKRSPPFPEGIAPIFSSFNHTHL